MGSDAQQAGRLYKMTYRPSKLGQIGLVFGLWSEFISRPVHAQLQVSKCSHIAVMGKPHVESYCQMSNHSTDLNHLAKSQISNPIFSSNLLVTNLKSNLKSLIFVLNWTFLFTYFPQYQKQCDTCTVGQWLQSSYCNTVSQVAQNWTACEAAVLPQCMQLAEL